MRDYNGRINKLERTVANKVYRQAVVLLYADREPDCLVDGVDYDDREIIGCVRRYYDQDGKVLIEEPATFQDLLQYYDALEGDEPNSSTNEGV